MEPTTVTVPIRKRAFAVALASDFPGASSRAAARQRSSAAVGRRAGGVAGGSSVVTDRPDEEDWMRGWPRTGHDDGEGCPWSVFVGGRSVCGREAGDWDHLKLPDDIRCEVEAMLLAVEGVREQVHA